MDWPCAFWEDIWLGDISLTQQYPLLYNIVQQKNVLVVNVLAETPLSIAFRLVTMHSIILWYHAWCIWYYNMTLPSQCMISYCSIIISLYLMICGISMQNCVQDLFDIGFSSYTCYDTISTYDTTIVSLIINYKDTSAFCMHRIHDTGYDTTIMASLRRELSGNKWNDWLHLCQRLMMLQLSDNQINLFGSVKSMYLDLMNGHTRFLRTYL
jgi:hypothetical protein